LFSFLLSKLILEETTKEGQIEREGKFLSGNANENNNNEQEKTFALRTRKKTNVFLCFLILVFKLISKQYLCSHYSSYISLVMAQGYEILSMKIALHRRNFIDKNRSGKPLVHKKEINSSLLNLSRK